MFEHTTFGFCAWDIPTLIVLLVMIGVFIGHRYNQKKREKEFTKELEEKQGTAQA